MSGTQSGGGPGGARAVIFEFYQIGTSVKVTAVDEATGVEVSIVGPSGALRSDLEKVARAKLMRALERAADPKKQWPPK